MTEELKFSLKSARLYANLTQAEAAGHLGVDEATVRNYELGKTEPKFSMLTAMSDLYGIPVDSLVLKN